MFRRLLGLVLVLGVSSPTFAEDLPAFPQQVPPIVGTAVASEAGNAAESSEWRIALRVPRIHWEIVGELVAKQEWPRLKVEVEKVQFELVMGGPSQLAESRVFDMQGNALSRVQVLRRLVKEVPVLVSVSGEIPDAYFLQLTKPDTLIVVLGPRDGYPAPELLPAKSESATEASDTSER